ncbi:ABC transporter permease [Streptomyces spiroverticillatus]|uniref:ABC transporter permease n=1 Tax=Streptomyces finlayi TaxID=67296 RepID=A0A918WTR1_9ACTN|nr:ABC transporter permease [Streptomyces spiroverticillatus]GHC81801.1 ABC transporter permease [Streptomyces finlayi]
MRLRGFAGRAVALLAVVLAVGLLPWLTRNDPALTILHARYADRPPTPETLAAIRAETGLDGGPLHVLGGWLGAALRGDFGVSWVSGAPVGPDVTGALGVSLSLMGCSLLVAVVLAGLLCLRTLRLGARRGLVRARAGVVGAVLAALPEFLIAAVLATVFAVQLGWFPAVGWGTFAAVVLPAVAMGIPAGALLGRLLDDALPGAFAEPWARAAAAGGIPGARVALHALRRTLPGVLPQFGFVVVGLTGGAVAVETLFAIPGLGGTALAAALAQDLPVLQASVLVLLLLGVAAGLAVRGLGRLLLGPALRDGALPTLVRPRLEAGRAVRWGAVLVTVVFVGVVVAGLLRDPYAIDVTARLAGPGAGHPLGTDSLGRDTLARLGHGAGRTVLAALAVSVVTLVVGVLVGLLPGAGGFTEMVNALPAIVAGLVVAGVAGPGAVAAAVAVSVVAWAPLAAHTRALYEQERAAPHVAAARALGAGRGWVLRRHVLPGVLPGVVRHAVLRIPALALALASLSFLGLGAAPPAPEWGRMLAENLPYAERAPWSVLAPAAALVVLGVGAVLWAAVAGAAGRRGRLSTAVDKDLVEVRA